MGRYKMTKPAIRKRAFLLLELLISLALITLCLLPLVKPHASMRKEDRKILEEMQFERVAQEAFCKLKEKLYENREHTWEMIRKGKAAGELPKTFTIQSGKETTKRYTCSYTIEELDYQKKPSQGKVGSVIEIQLHFSPPPFNEEKSPFLRTLYLERREA